MIMSMICSAFSEIGIRTFDKIMKHNNFLSVFSTTGKALSSIESDKQSEITDKIRILFSEEMMKEISEKSEDKTGYELLEFVDEEIRKVFNAYDLQGFDLERYIQVFNNEFENNLRIKRPDLYDQHFLQKFSKKTEQDHQHILEGIGNIIHILTDKHQFGQSLYDIEKRLEICTEPYRINFDFFDYEERKIDEVIINEIKDRSIIQVQFRAKEEGLYYILRLLKFYFPERINDIVVIENEQEWQCISKTASNLILIPYFVSDRINPVPDNKTIFILNEEAFNIKRKVIKVPNRVRANLFFKLNSYIGNNDKTHKIIETTQGVYASLMRSISNAYFNNPRWTNGSSADLIPAALLAMWTTNPGDKEIVSQLAGLPYDKYLSSINESLNIEDPFIICYKYYSTMEYRVSDISEAIECLKKWITKEILYNFAECAKNVLLTPHSFLNEAGIIEMSGKYSLTLKKGISKTLVVMALNAYSYGDGYEDNLKSFVSNTISNIMSSLDTKIKWNTISDLFPLLMEAAPSIVLDKIEKCVNCNDKDFWSLFEPEKGAYSYNSSYVHVLDSLAIALFLKDVSSRALTLIECIANKEVEYKLVNSPFYILSSYFSRWYYEVDISPDKKIELLKCYARKYPKSCWKVMKNVLPMRLKSTYNPLPKPLYSSYDVALNPTPLNEQTMFDISKEYFLIAFECAGKDLSKWAEFFEQGIFINYGLKDELINNLIHLLTDDAYSDKDKYLLEKKIRRFLYNQRYFAKQASFTEDDLRDIEYKLLKSIKYSNNAYKYLYVFDEAILDINPFSSEEEETDYMKNFNKKSNQQALILQDNLKTNSFCLKDLIVIAYDDYDFGVKICKICYNNTFDIDLASFLFQNNKINTLHGYFRQFIQTTNNDNDYFSILKQLREQKLDLVFLFRFLEAHIINDSFINKIVELEKELQIFYWENTSNHWFDRDKFTEVDKYICNLVTAGNFKIIDFLLHEFEFYLETYILILQRALLTKNLGNMGSYRVKQVFKKIYEFDICQSDLIEQVIKLEIYYAGFFYERYEPKYTLKKLKQEPTFSAFLLANIYSKENEQTLTRCFSNVLRHVKFCPCENDGKIDDDEIVRWCETFLLTTQKNDQSTIGRIYLGQFLANCPQLEKEDAWPLPSVCKVIEQFYSPELDEGFTIEVLNNRGIHVIGSGEEEKRIAQKYDYYSKQLEFMYPKTAMMLRKIRDSYLEEAEDNRSRAEHEY